MYSINEIEDFLGKDKTEIHDGFFCVLTGQFSSGKSKFMNKLFGEEYLPVGTREMTATPTYIKRGRSEAAVFHGCDSEAISISEIKDYRKGFCNCEKIELSLDCPNIPENIVFIDTPGINSTASGKCEKELFKADAVLYFMAKSISATDVEEIDSICRQKDVKLILVRTRIDDIKKSEENIFETCSEERTLINRIYPAADFYFVSLVDDRCDQNEISRLMAYIKYDLEKELCARREMLTKKYVSNTLIPALVKMEADVCVKDVAERADNQERETKKQLKAIRKNVLGHAPKFREQMNSAKGNYIKNGSAFIQKQIENKGYVSGKEIQAYILDCIRGLEEWYGLEFEDVIANVGVNEETGKKQELISDELVSDVFSKYEEIRSRFTDYTDLGKSDRFKDISSAERELKNILDSIFIKIDAGFLDGYAAKIDGIVEVLKEQYKKRNKLIEKYATNETENLCKIKQYLSELENDGTDQEIA